MTTVAIDTWVQLATLAVFAIALLRYLDKKFDQVDARFDTRFDELRNRIDRLEAKTERRFELFDTKFERFDAKFDLLRIEFHQIATGSAPRPLIIPPH